MTTIYDLVIVGGGPSGLSAAINGASEGLSVAILDAERTFGGQARESAAIENYAGFPDGITGDALMSALVRQAVKFETSMYCPVTATRVSRDHDLLTVLDEFGNEYVAKTVLLSLGLSYRRLNARGVGPLMGRGCFYGVPNGKGPGHQCTLAVVGGANSAGQAVLHLAKNPRADVHLLIRKTIEAQMSTYLIKRIRATPNITICENCEVVEAIGSDHLRELHVVRDGVEVTMPAQFMFIYIGALPKTYWLRDCITLDDHGFIETWAKDTLPFETSLQGVFAAGDVRVGSVKRIAAAVGEGATALQMIHKRLGE